MFTFLLQSSFKTCWCTRTCSRRCTESAGVFLVAARVMAELLLYIGRKALRLSTGICLPAAIVPTCSEALWLRKVDGSVVGTRLHRAVPLRARPVQGTCRERSGHGWGPAARVH